MKEKVKKGLVESVEKTKKFLNNVKEKFEKFGKLLCEAAIKLFNKITLEIGNGMLGLIRGSLKAILKSIIEFIDAFKIKKWR